MFNKYKLPRTKPKHIGFILDGNRRWAKMHKFASKRGHAEGIEAIKKTVDALLKFGIPHASMFAFSTENWKRSKDEVDAIFDLVRDYFKNECDEFVKKGVKVKIFGDISSFPDDLQNIFHEVIAKTENNSKLTLNVLLNYGGRADIVQAVNKLIKNGKDIISEEDISNNLYSKGQPDLDLVIRTSGEMRISNFMIYQLAYAEFYFPKIYWPDFDKKALYKALKIFSKRERRYGGF